MLRTIRGVAVVAIIGVNLSVVGSARPAIAATPGCATVSGIVFVDSNRNGINDDHRGLRGVAVTAYGDNDVVVASGKTAKGGAFSLTIPDAVLVRVEFGELPAGYALGPHGVDSATSVVFPESPNCSANLGVVRPPKPIGDCKRDDDDGCEREHEHERGTVESTTATAAFVAGTARTQSVAIQVAVVQAPSQLPIEIGNRVWADTNGNGIQDPSESAIVGVTVSLFLNGSRIDATITDAKGEYYFSAVAPNTSYEIRLDSPSDLGNGKIIDARVWLPTAAFAARPTIDSNAVNVGGVPTITAAVTGAAGVSDHSFDIGLTPKARLSLNAVNAISTSPQTGSYLTFDLLVTNLGPGSAGNPITVAGGVPVGIIYESVSFGWKCAVTAVEFACTASTNLAPGGNTPFTAKFLVSAKGAQPVGLSVLTRSANDGVGITGNSYQYVGVAFEVSAVTFTRPDPTPSSASSSVTTLVSTTATSGTTKAGTTKGGTAAGQNGSAKTSTAAVLGSVAAKGGGLAITGANAIRFGLIGLLLTGFGGCLVAARRRAKA